MKYLILWLLILLTPILTYSQANYKKGLVVTTQGDTLQGFIDYQEWVKNPKSISFKATLAQREAQEFTPGASKYFALEGLESYESFSGRASADRTDFNNVPTAIDTSKTTIQAFLKILQAGQNVTLFSLSDELKIRFFIRDAQAGKLQELGFRRYIDPVRDDLIRASKPYMGQLLVIATNLGVATPALKRQIELSDFNSTDLVKITTVLNKISKKEGKSVAGRKSYQVFAGIGLNQAVTRVDGNHELNHKEVENKASSLPKYAIGADFFLNPNVRRLVFRAEAAFTQTNQKNTREYVDDEVGGRKDIYVNQEFKQNIISFSPQILYNIYNQDHLKFFAGTGISANLIAYPVNSFYREVTYNGANTTTVSRKEYFRLEKFWIIVPVRAGVKFRKVEFSAIYFPPTTITKYADFAFVTNSVHFQLNYFIIK